MHDSIVRILGNVRHVSDSKKKLIFLGNLETIDYKFSAEGRVLRVSKCSLIMMKEKKVNTLYILKGSTVIGDVVMSLSEDTDLDTTHLLHMQLGHMSKRELSMLSKQGMLCSQKICKFDFCEHYAFEKQHKISFGTGVS